MQPRFTTLFTTILHLPSAQQLFFCKVLHLLLSLHLAALLRQRLRRSNIRAAQLCNPKTFENRTIRALAPPYRVSFYLMIRRSMCQWEQPESSLRSQCRPTPQKLLSDCDPTTTLMVCTRQFHQWTLSRGSLSVYRFLKRQSCRLCFCWGCQQSDNVVLVQDGYSVTLNK